MLQNETGPYAIFRRLQAWAASRPDTQGGIQQAFFCFWCLSMWVAVPFAVGLSLIDPLAPWWSVPIFQFGLSAGAIILNTHISDKK